MEAVLEAEGQVEATVAAPASRTALDLSPSEPGRVGAAAAARAVAASVTQPPVMQRADVRCVALVR